MEKRILFVTTTSLSANPRLVKEIITAINLGYSFTVVAFRLGNWSDKLDDKLLQNYPAINVVYLNAHRGALLHWFVLAILERACGILWPFFKKNKFITSSASNRRSLQLCRYFWQNKTSFSKFDLIVAHNLGALYPAFYLSRLIKVPFAFDVEDYHPGEIISMDALNEKERRELLLKSLLANAAYVSVASPLIGNEVRTLCKISPQLISNCFFSHEFKLNLESQKDKIKLVWFSQNINFNRGLELLFPALDTLQEKFSLTLIGNLDPSFAELWLKGKDYVEVLSPIEQTQLHNTISEYDVGLALELSDADLNKEIALSNKIFAYTQAGLYILATNTKAQKMFINEFSIHGIYCNQTIEGMTHGLKNIASNIADIRAAKPGRFHAAKKIAFESEAQKLAHLWSDAFPK